MKKLIACLLLGALFGVALPMVSAQEEQSPQHLAQEIETLKHRVSELEKQLQTVENVEKLELAKNYTDAQAKLLNAEFGKFERELRDSNSKWITGWILFFVATLSAVGIVVVREFRSSADKLIKNEVEKSLTGFKESLKELGILENQLLVLEKEHAASTLESIMHSIFSEEHPHPEQVKAFREEALLAVFSDEKYLLSVRYRAAEVLAISKKSPRFVSPVLNFLNSVVDSDLDIDFETEQQLKGFANLFAYIHTGETYEGLTKFLNRLLTENPKHKQLFLTEIVFSLAMVSLRLNLGNSVSMLRLAIPQLDVGQHYNQAIKNLARQFDIFNEPAGIKEILTSRLASRIPDVEEKCLELLEKHDPKFVEEWRARKTADESEA